MVSNITFSPRANVNFSGTSKAETQPALNFKQQSAGDLVSFGCCKDNINSKHKNILTDKEFDIVYPLIKELYPKMDPFYIDPEEYTRKVQEHNLIFLDFEQYASKTRENKLIIKNRSSDVTKFTIDKYELDYSSYSIDKTYKRQTSEGKYYYTETDNTGVQITSDKEYISISLPPNTAVALKPTLISKISKCFKRKQQSNLEAYYDLPAGSLKDVDLHYRSFD